MMGQLKAETCSHS